MISDSSSWFVGEKIVGSKILLPSSSCTLSLYHLVSTFIGILLTFSPMHFLGFNVMARRIPDFPDSFHSWNFLSSIGSGITFLSFAVFSKPSNESPLGPQDSFTRAWRKNRRRHVVIHIFVFFHSLVVYFFIQRKTTNGKNNMWMTVAKVFFQS